MGLVLSFFQDGFTASLRTSLLELKFKDRLGMIAAFILADVDDAGHIDLDKFQNFFQAIEPNSSPEHMRRVFDAINSDDGDGEEDQVLDIREFIMGIEYSSEIRMDAKFFTPFSYEQFIVKFPYDSSNSIWWKFKYCLQLSRWRLYPFVSSEYFNMVVLSSIILQIMVLTLYGSVSNSAPLDLANGFLLIFNIFDLLCKMVVYGEAVSSFKS